jgi:glycosyltransferase involved in cell wall biosynthesis
MLKRVARLLGRKQPPLRVRVDAQVRDNFDADHYRVANGDLPPGIDLIEHYSIYGWREGRDPALWFSVLDYLEDYPDVRAARIDPFEHYLRHGKGEGRLIRAMRGSEARAARDFAETYGRFFPEYPQDFNHRIYRLASGKTPTDRWDALRHFLEKGLFDKRVLAVIKPSAQLLEAAGDYYEEIDRNKALRCFDLAAYEEPNRSSVLSKIGDCHYASQQLTSARLAYVQAIEAGSRSYWTHHNLGNICTELGDFDDAIEYLGEAVRIRPEKYAARGEQRDAAAERFHVEWSYANDLSMIGQDESAKARMADAVRDYISVVQRPSKPPLFAQERRTERQSVALFGSDLLSQCKLYRVTQKQDQFASIGLPLEFYSLQDSDKLLKEMLRFDKIIIYRAPALPEVTDVLLQAQAFGIVTYYDIDDLIFDQNHYPPSRESLGDMISPLEYAGLVTGSVLFREALKLSKYGITSTPPLQEPISALIQSGECFLSRNALGRTHADFLAQHGTSDAPGRDEFVLLYGSGSRSHNDNFRLIARPLAALMRKHPHVELRLCGPVEIGPEFNELKTQITRVPFRSVADYWQELATADINLAPLTSSIFNDAKSEIKWMEAAMLGIPSVVSSSAVYDDVVRSGVDGFVARSEKDWEHVLTSLVADRSLGRQVGSKARERVLSEYDLATQARNLVEIITSGSEISAGDGPPRKPLVLVVNIFYPPEFIGGATRIVEQTVTDLHRSCGDELSFEVLCGREYDDQPGAVARYQWHDVNVTSLSPFTDQDAIERSVDTDSFFEAYVRRIKPDLIHFHCIQRLGGSLLDVAGRLEVPYVVTVHDGWWISDRQFLIDDEGVPVFESGKWGEPRRLKRLGELLNKAAATIAVSREHGRLYESRGIRNVVTIPNGSETIPGVSAPERQGPVWLGLLGGLGIAKGSELLRDALRRRTFKNLRFLVVDHSKHETSIHHELWGENPVEVRGKASFDAVSKIYSRLHVVLAISVCVESFGLVAREAQRLGRWVIASNRGGMAEDVTEGLNGHVIDPSTVADLIRVLERIDSNPDLYRQAPEAVFPLRGREDVAADYLALYRSILGGQGVGEHRSSASPMAIGSA